MAYGFDAAKNFFSGLLTNVPARETVWKSITDNNVAQAVRPYFSKAYNTVSGPVKSHSYIVGAVGIIVAAAFINIFISKGGKPPAK